MRTLYYLIALLFLVNIRYAQAQALAPAWDWAVQGHGDDSNGGNAIAVDASGNSYVAGYFVGDSVVLGSATLYHSIPVPGPGSCFLVKYDASGNTVWAEPLNGQVEIVSSFTLCADDSGNVYVTGSYSGNLQLGSIPLSSTGSSDIFVAKYDSFGSVVWAASAGGSSAEGGTAIAIDSLHQVYVGGNFFSTSFSFGSSLLTISNPTAPPDLFLLKFDSNGNPVWGLSADGDNTDGVQSIATDRFGNIYMTGIFLSDSLVLGTTILYRSGFPPAGDTYIARVNSSGAFQWARKVGGSEEDFSYGLCCDAAGYIYNSGFFNSDTLSVGTTVLINAGATDGFIVKYDSSGTVMWVRQNSGVGGWALQAGPGNVIYGSGDYFDSTVFGGTTFPRLGDEACVFTYDSAGNELWMQVSTGTNTDFARSIAVTGAGEAMITGDTYSDTLQFGSTLLADTAFGTRLFVARQHAMPVGVNEIQSPRTKIYPNPANEWVNVFSEERILKIELYSIPGEKVFQQFPNTQHIRIRIPSQGVFLLRMETESGVTTRKVVGIR